MFVLTIIYSKNSFNKDSTVNKWTTSIYEICYQDPFICFHYYSYQQLRHRYGTMTFFFNFEQVTYLIWKSSFLNPNIRVKRFDWLSWINLKTFLDVKPFHYNVHFFCFQCSTKIVALYTKDKKKIINLWGVKNKSFQQKQRLIRNAESEESSSFTCFDISISHSA